MDVAIYGSERIADLVSDSGGKTTDARHFLNADEMRALLEQSVGHSVHAVGEVVHLTRFARRQATCEIARGYRLGGSHRVAQRAQDDPVYLVRDIGDEN